MDVLDLIQKLSEETEIAVINNDIAELKRIRQVMDEYEGDLPDMGFEFYNCMLTDEQLDAVYGDS